MKSVKMFGKSVPLLAIVIASMLAIGASAILLTSYGTITSTVNVDQSVLLDEGAGSVTDTIDAVGGNTVFGGEHWLTNDAEVRIVVDLVTEGGYDVAIIDIFPMYKLDALLDDDFVSMSLSDDVTWGSFAGVSFDYLIETDLFETLDDTHEGLQPWIPQINIKLLDSEGEMGYYASWHSFRHGITGTVGEPTSITALKGDFYLFDASWTPLGLWSAVSGTYSDANAMEFSTFSQQAGDTSVDPNNPEGETQGGNPYWPAKSAQVVYVGNHAISGETIEGIVIVPMGTYTASWVYDMGQMETVEFRMVYETAYNGLLVGETVTTNVVPIGLQ